MRHALRETIPSFPFEVMALVVCRNICIFWAFPIEHEDFSKLVRVYQIRDEADFLRHMDDLHFNLPDVPAGIVVILFFDLLGFG